MVHQMEAETADNGENAGAGSIPCVFVTMTSAVYKWEQLHTTMLKSYPSGSHARLDFESWRLLSTGSDAREEAMKKVYHLLAVQNPGIVAWYCGLKLEIVVHLLRFFLTRMLEGDDSRCRLTRSSKSWAGLRFLCLVGVERWRSRPYARGLVDYWNT